jgi:hypothetical protein
VAGEGFEAPESVTNTVRAASPGGGSRTVASGGRAAVGVHADGIEGGGVRGGCGISPGPLVLVDESTGVSEEGDVASVAGSDRVAKAKVSWKSSGMRRAYHTDGGTRERPYQSRRCVAT